MKKGDRDALINNLYREVNLSILASYNLKCGTRVNNKTKDNVSVHSQLR